MRLVFNTVIALIFITPTFAIAEKAMTLHEIQLTGKNIATMTGFYETCGAKGVITIKRQASRLGYYSATKYFVIGGISNEMNHWADKGQEGFMFGDINKSDKPERFKFTSANCNIIKKAMEARLDLILNMLSI